MKKKSNTNLDKHILYWKKRTEFIFVFLMSLLLIYLFNPYTYKLAMINNETRLLLFAFGFLLIISADWNTFVHEAKWFKTLQNVVSNKQ
jgi:hypothetical protein